MPRLALPALGVEVPRVVFLAISLLLSVISDCPSCVFA